MNCKKRGEAYCSGKYAFSFHPASSTHPEALAYPYFHILLAFTAQFSAAFQI